MSHLKYHNNLVDIVNTFYDSHLDLIRNICNELGHTDRIKEMEQKFLDDTNKLKAKKDPLKPKRPKSSYLFFCDDMRPILMLENPKATLSDISKKLGKMWQECDKSTYLNKSIEDKDRYKSEIDNYKF